MREEVYEYSGNRVDVQIVKAVASRISDKRLAGAMLALVESHGMLEVRLARALRRVADLELLLSAVAKKRKKAKTVQIFNTKSKKKSA